MKAGDIDLDFKDRNEVLKLIKHIPASRISNGELVKHNTSVYVQNIPVDPETGLAAFDYQMAETLGYSKIDFLNLDVYSEIKDEAHLNELIQKEPEWGLLEIKEVVEQLFQIHGSFNIVNRMKPKTIDQLAMVLALIRPAKRHLIGRPWSEIEKEIWSKDDEGYSFKRSHAFAYSMVIVMQMNRLMEG